MKTRLLFFSSLIFTNLAFFAQNKINLVIFSEDGDAFYAFVNGVKQNTNPETNVKVTDVTPNISLRIEFENKALPQLKQNMALEPGFEHTAKIKRDMKKQLKLRYFGQTPLNSSSNNGMTTVAYHTADASGSDNSATTSGTDNSTTNYTTTTTTTQINNTANPNGSSVNVNVGGVGVNMNVSGMDMNSGTVQSTSSTTVTSTSSSSSNTVPKNVHNKHQETNEVESGPRPIAPKSGCGYAMSQASFDKMKQSVEDKPFSDTKMSTAKVATKNNCLSVNQIKEICKLFSMDDDKLAYAKFAYDYCVDKPDFYTVSEVFSFSSTTDNLNEFLEKH